MNAVKPRYRETPQRKVILEELRRFDSHPSADEIFEKVRQRLPRISLGTVYRNLDILVEMDLIRKLEVGGTLKRYDPITEPHYHIRCTCCDRIIDAPLKTVESMETELKALTDFKIIGHHLEFVGLCPDCAQNPMAPGLGKIPRTDRQRNSRKGRQKDSP